MTPEQQARLKIDQQLAECGWLVQKSSEMNISAGPGVAVREFPLKTGFADYLLYANGKVIGAIEAKPEGHNGSITEIGRSALWSAEIDDCVHQNHIIRVRFFAGSPKYLLELAGWKRAGNTDGDFDQRALHAKRRQSIIPPPAASSS